MQILNKITKIFRQRRGFRDKQADLTGVSYNLLNLPAPKTSIYENFATIRQYYISSHVLNSAITLLREASLQVGVDFNNRVDEKLINNLIKNLSFIYTDMYLYSKVFFDNNGMYEPNENINYDFKAKIYYKKTSANDKKVVYPVVIKDGISPVIPLNYVIEKSIFLDIKEKESIINWGEHGILTEDSGSGYGLTQEDVDVINKKYQEMKFRVGAGGVLVVGKKMKFERIGLTPSEANSKELYVNIIRQVANQFGFDSSLLNDYQNKTYSNKRESYIGLYYSVVLPTIRHFWKNYFINFSISKYIPVGISMYEFVDISTENIPYLRMST